MLDDIAAEFGTTEALVSVFENRRLTYAQFRGEVDRCARALMALGVGKGERVGIWSTNCAAWVIVQFATAKVGAVLVNLNPAYRLSELEFTLNQSEANCLILGEGFKDACYSEMLAKLRGTNSHHHCLALEPFHGGQPEPIVDALARALRPGGQMVITELAAVAPLNQADPIVRRWAELEHRDPLDLLAPVAVTRMLGRIGLDVRVAEDISDRHMEQALAGWRARLRVLREAKQPPQQAVHLVREAELWLLRRRLIRDGRLRMMRWHAISRPPSVVQ